MLQRIYGVAATATDSRTGVCHGSDPDEREHAGADHAVDVAEHVAHGVEARLDRSLRARPQRNCVQSERRNSAATGATRKVGDAIAVSASRSSRPVHQSLSGGVPLT